MESTKVNEKCPLGGKMARFIDGHWRGTYWKVRPLGWRRYCHPKFVFPYMIGDRIQFTLEVLKRETSQSPKLNQLEIFEVFPKYKDKLLSTTQFCSDEETICEYKDEKVTTEPGRVEYWVGNPQGNDSFPLILAGTYCGDKLMIVLLVAILIALITAVVKC